MKIIEAFNPEDIVRIDSNYQLIYLHKKYTSGTLAYDLINKEELIFNKTFDLLEHAIITIENDELIKRFKFSKYLEDKKILKDLTVGYYLKMAAISG